MSENRDESAVWEVVTEWMASANADKRAIEACLALDPPLVDVVAFHCQQAAEKLLKGFLVLAGHRFRKSHDLEELGTHVRRHFPDLTDLVASVEAWTIWNIAYRYPGEEAGQPQPSITQLEESLKIITHLSSALQAMAPHDQADRKS